MLPRLPGQIVSISLHVLPRLLGYQVPLGDDDKVFVYAGRGDLLFVASGALIKALMRHHIDGIAVQAAMSAELKRRETVNEEDRPMPTENPVIPSEREVRRAQRRSRKPPNKMIVLLPVVLLLAAGCAPPAARTVTRRCPWWQADGNLFMQCETIPCVERPWWNSCELRDANDSVRASGPVRVR